MSSVTGEVIRDKQIIIGYFDYCGTTDVAMPKIFKTAGEVVHRKRDQELSKSEWEKCECGPDVHIDVLLYVDYGGGFHWPAKICLRRNVIIDGHRPYIDEDVEGFKNGHPFGPNRKQLD
jgi:hypothetical protein